MLPVTRTAELYHIGSLNKNRMKGESQESNFLSASLTPESWEFIARLGGEPLLILKKEDATFVDFMSITDDVMRGLIDEAMSDGLLIPATSFRAWYHDGEADDWRYMTFWDRDKAEYEVEDQEPDGAPNGVLVEEIQGHRLTETGIELLPRLPDDEAFIRSAVVMLHVLKNPDLYDGVYWDEDDDPVIMSAPRYGISPLVLNDFVVEGPHGELSFDEYVSSVAENYDLSDDFSV